MLVKCQHPGVKCSHVSDDYVCSAVQAVDECLCEDLGEDCVVVVVVSQSRSTPGLLSEPSGESDMEGWLGWAVMVWHGLVSSVFTTPHHPTPHRPVSHPQNSVGEPVLTRPR